MWEVSYDNGETWTSLNVQAQEQTPDFIFEEYEDGYQLIRYEGNAASVTVPSTYEGKPVRAIAAYAFAFNINMRELIIPNSVTRMGESICLACTRLEKVTLPFLGVTADDPRTFSTLIGNGISPLSLTITGGTSICTEALAGCTVLENITLPFVGTTTATGTENSSFRSLFGVDNDSVPKSLKAVTITGGTSIGDSVFSGCAEIESIAIPFGVTSIGQSAFSGCSSLQSITIPDSVTSIGMDAFTGSGAIQIENGVSYVDKWVVRFDRSVTSVSFRSDTVGFAFAAFAGCPFQSIVIPSGVTIINSWAFGYCGTLESITIPSSVTSIGSSVFTGCSNVTINVEASAKPDGWDVNWNPENYPINWGYTLA